MESLYWTKKVLQFQPSTVWIISLILIFVSSTPSVHGAAKVYLKLDKYENPGSIQADGTCCDGEVRNNACISGCDYSVVICLGDGVKSPCNLATFNVGALGTNEPIVNLGNVYPDGFSNPIGIPLNEWTGSVLITITVYDVDTRERQLVDKIQFYHNMTSPGRGRSPFLNMTSMTISGSRQINPSKLTLEVTTRCDVYFYSDSCNVNCVPSDDCSGHYECNRTTGERICRSGWGGPQCDQTIDANLTCPATTCSHRGTCFTTDKSYYCCCHDGYEGEHCEKDINECISSPCQHGGYCVQATAPGYKCDCNGRYKGKLCETAKTCEDKPCLNGGKCLNFTQTFQCDCEMTTYRGEFCEVPTSTASSVTPVQIKKCHGNYYGPDCLTYCRATDDCSGHFTCEPGTGRRVCLPGWTQESNCAARITTSPADVACACQNGGQCFNGSCCCPVEYTGNRCQDRALFCPNKPCLNGGTCYEKDSEFWCICPEMFTGETCETMMYPNRNCKQDYYGPQCEQNCKPSYQCGSTVGQYYCNELTGQRICMFGWLGPLCDQRDPNANHAVPCPKSICRNGGACFNSTCCCAPGYTGSLCHIEILECESSPCLNGAACTDLINGYLCTCKEGFTGTNCEMEQKNPVPKNETDEYGDPCDDVTCLNGGTCLTTGKKDFICLCQGERFVGLFCEREISPRSPNPYCPMHYYSNNCSVNCVEENSAEGHYLCDSSNGSKICRCGWKGVNCTERAIPVVVDPECPVLGTGCKHNGACFNGTCLCPYPYSGKFCEEEKLACSYLPCGLFGECLDIPSGYVCQCSPGYTGKNCNFLDERSGPGLTMSFLLSSETDTLMGPSASIVPQSHREMWSTASLPIQTAATFSAYETSSRQASQLETVASKSEGSASISGSQIMPSISGTQIASSELIRTTDTAVNSALASQSMQSQQVATSQITLTASPNFNTLSSASVIAPEASRTTAVIFLSGSTDSMHAMTESQSVYPSVRSSLEPFSADVRASETIYVSVPSLTKAADSSNLMSGSYFTPSSSASGFATAPINTLLPLITIKEDISSIKAASTSTLGSQITPSVTLPLSMSSETVSATSCGSIVCFNGGVCQSTPTGNSCKCPRENMGQFCEIMNTSRSTASFPGSATPSLNTLLPFTISKEDISSIKTVQTDGLGSQITPFATLPLSMSSETASATICGNIVCFNGGVCQSTTSGNSCKCPRDNMGQFCENMDTLRSSATFTGFATASIYTLLPLATNTGDILSVSKTVISPSLESHITPFATLPLSTTSETVGATSCGSFTCLNGGLCQSSPTGTSCKCPRENMGQFCELLGTMTVTPITYSGIATASLNTLLPFTTNKEDLSSVSKTVISSILGSQINPSATLPFSVSSEATSVTFCGSIICFNGGVCQLSPNGLTCKCPRENMGTFCEIMDTTRYTASFSGSATPSLNTLLPLTASKEDISSIKIVQTDSLGSQITPFATLSVSMSSETTSAIFCGSIVCFNGGVCQSSPTGNSCKCPRENMGQFCEIMDTTRSTASVSGSATPSLNTLLPFTISKEDISSIKTVQTDGLGSQITPFATLSVSMSSETTSAIFCGSIVCFNGGVCQSSPTGNSCKCPRENMGQFCEIMDTTRSTAPVSGSATPSLNTLLPFTISKEDISSIKTVQTTGLGSQITPFATLPLSMSSETASATICGNIVCLNGGVCQSSPTGNGYTCKCPRENMGQFCEIMDTTRYTASFPSSTTPSLNTLLPFTISKEDISSIKTVQTDSLGSQITPFTTVPFSMSSETASAIFCGSIVCFNGGVCQSSPTGNSCKCPRENMGQFCEIMDTTRTTATYSGFATASINTLLPITINKENTLSVSKTVVASSLASQITPFATLPLSTTSETVSATSCGSYVCLNGGVCDSSPMGRPCKCPRENMGQFCEILDTVTGSTPNTVSFSSMSYSLTTVPKLQESSIIGAQSNIAQLGSTFGLTSSGIVQVVSLTGSNVHTGSLSSMDATATGYPTTMSAILPSQYTESASVTDILGQLLSTAGQYQMSSQTPFLPGVTTASVPVFGTIASLQSDRSSQQPLGVMTGLSVFPSMSAHSSVELSISSSASHLGVFYTVSQYSTLNAQSTLSPGIGQPSSSLNPTVSELVFKTMTPGNERSLSATASIDTALMSSRNPSNTQSLLLDLSSYPMKSDLSHFSDNSAILHSTNALPPFVSATNTYLMPLDTTLPLNSALTGSGSLTITQEHSLQYSSLSQSDYSKQTLLPSLSGASLASGYLISASVTEQTSASAYTSAASLGGSVATTETQKPPTMTAYPFATTDRYFASPIDSSLYTAQFVPTARLDSSMSSFISQRPSTAAADMSMSTPMSYLTPGLPVSTYVSLSPSVSSLQRGSTSPTSLSTGTLTASLPSSYASVSSSVLATTPSSGSTSKPGKPITGEIYIINRISDLKLLIQLIQTAILSAFQPAKPCCFTIVADDSDKYFDDVWNPLVRIEYTFTPPSGDLDMVIIRGVMLTELDSLLIATDVFISNDNRVYRGLPHGPEVIFSLDITGEVVMATYAKIGSVIDESWIGSNPGCGCRYRSQIVYGQRSVGRYGTLVTRLYYVMYKNDLLQLTYTREAPTAEYIVSTFNARRDLYGIYRQSQVMSYLNAFQAVANAAIKLTSQRGLQAAAVLRNQWQRYLNNSQCRGSACNVSVSYVRPDVLYSDVSPEAVLTSLSYFVYLNGVLIKPASYRGPTALEIGGLFSPCACQKRASQSFYVYGEIPYFTLNTLINEMIPGEKQATILSREYYYDIYGALVTKVFFRPSVFGSWVPPKSNNSFKNVFAIRSLKVLEDGMPLKQQYRIVLNGALTTQSVEPVQKTLKDAWCSNNRDIAPDDLSTYVIKMDSANFTTSNGSQVTVIHYVVVVDQADASLTIAEEPAADSIADAFNRTSGGKLVVCACPVSKQQNIGCLGNLNAANSTQLDAVKKTLEDAWRDANKDYTGNITINIRNITTNQTRDKEQTIVFSVALDGGQPGVTDLDLRRPSGSSLQTRFTDAESYVALVQDSGSQTRTGQNDEFPWYIPVAVVLALLLAFVTIFVFICVFRGRRKGSKEIDNNPDDFREDNYDKEHFTMEPVAFDNEAFRNLQMTSQNYEMNTDQSDYGPF